MSEIFEDVFFNLDDIFAEKKPEEEPVRKDEVVSRITQFKTMQITKKMRILSEAALLDVADWFYEKGTAYHYISCGDVDSLSFFKHILRQQKIKYAIIATWVMATKDAETMLEWLNKGLIGRYDFYVGEIFRDIYEGDRERGCLNVLYNISELCGGRVARFRNHSKVIVVYGEKFDAVIESSANIDTNPRTEQTCITCDTGLCDFYKEFYDGIKDFDGRFKNWKKWEAV